MATQPGHPATLTPLTTTMDTTNQLSMQPDAGLTQQAIQALFEQERETRRLLQLVQRQNEVLLLLSRQQQTLLAQQRQTIHRLAAELQACRSAQKAAFSQVHTN